jgi:hypothetical protein
MTGWRWWGVLGEHREDFSFCVSGFLSLIAGVVVDVVGVNVAVDVEGLYGA